MMECPKCKVMRHPEALPAKSDICVKCLEQERDGLRMEKHALSELVDANRKEFEADVKALERERDDLKAEVEGLLAAANWTLGCNGSFAPRKDGQGAFWWRAELTRRAGLTYSAKDAKYLLRQALTTSPPKEEQ